MINGNGFNKYCIGFSMIRYSKDTTKVYIDGIEKGHIPMMVDASEGHHRVKIALLINFRWKEKSFDLDLQKNTLVVAEYNRFFGYYSVKVDGVKIA